MMMMMRRRRRRERRRKGVKVPAQCPTLILCLLFQHHLTNRNNKGEPLQRQFCFSPLPLPFTFFSPYLLSLPSFSCIFSVLASPSFIPACGHSPLLSLLSPLSSLSPSPPHKSVVVVRFSSSRRTQSTRRGWVHLPFINFVVGQVHDLP